MSENERLDLIIKLMLEARSATGLPKKLKTQQKIAYRGLDEVFKFFYLLKKEKVSIE